MSQDIKYFTACSHLVNDVQYEDYMCPRCYGKGYYIDLMLDEAGQVITTSGSIKLQQEMLKVLLDHRYSDVFSKNWGSEIYTLPGHKKLNITKPKLEMMVRRAIEFLRKVQQNEANTNRTITDEEIVGTIEYIDIQPISVTGWQLYIACSNSVSEIYTQTITF